jgi:glycosyltransferase involved in cell wall biosynthesis
VSRLLSRAGRPAPTGIDRVELAYATHLIQTQPDRLTLAAMANWGRFGPLPKALAFSFVRSLDRLWKGEPVRASPSALAALLHLSLLASGIRRLAAQARRADGPVVYLLLSHHHLDRTALLARIKEATGARFCCLIHDLIPIVLPEYARPGQTRRHRLRLRNAARLADGVIVNSAATGEALQARFARAVRRPPILAAPLGVEPVPPRAPGPPRSSRPYFIVLGTIEAKKNHLLLLNLWRRMAERHGEGTPELVVVGQRGWKIEGVVDLLERCPAVRRFVREHNDLSDAAVEPLLRGSRALLLPSFAEGFGLPVAEALARGVPVICSDLPALREAGGGAPEYLDPLDGPAWEAAILDYALPASHRRCAQLERLTRYRAPSWASHFAAVTKFLEESTPATSAAGAPSPGIASRSAPCSGAPVPAPLSAPRDRSVRPNVPPTGKSADAPIARAPLDEESAAR